MTTPVRVVLVDDQALLRASLATVLGADPRIDVVGEAGRRRGRHDGDRPAGHVAAGDRGPCELCGAARSATGADGL